MRNGMSQPGNGMIQSGNGMGDPFSDFTKSLQISMTPVVNEIVSEVKGPLLEVAKEAVAVATPSVQKIVKEDVLPKMSMYIIVGMLAAGAVGAFMAVTVLKR